MRTSRRAGIAIAVAVATIFVASVAGAAPKSSGHAVGHAPGTGADGPVVGNPGTTCAITNPGCNDRGLGGGDPLVVEPRPGMKDVVPTTFDTVTIGPDDRTLTITFWSGVEPCAVLDHVDITQGADAVTVTLFQGTDPAADSEVCIDIAVQKQTTVTLHDPVAGRAIVDGGA